MKKLIASLLTMVLVMSLAGCGSGDNREKVGQTTKTQEAVEPSGVSGGRTESGFNIETNKKIAWCGIDFSFPSYFDVLDKGSTETWRTYYPKEEDYYASIMFQSQDFSGTQEHFSSQIPSIVKSTIDGIANAELHKSEKISIAGLPGWTITFSVPDTKGDGVITTGSYSFAYNINAGKIVMISCGYDSNDKSQYDYLSDYEKVLKTAKLLNLTIENCEDLAALIHMDLKKDASSIQSFADKYMGSDIELELITAFVEPHKTYKTRFNYVLYAVDGDKAMLSGPAFFFKDVNYSDLHLTGSNQPETFGIGLHCRVSAEVEGFEDGFVLLDPVSIEVIKAY